MTLNIYVMPLTGTGTKVSPRQPKYLSTFASFFWKMFDYGNEPACMVGIIDVDSTTDVALTIHSDCKGLPVNLDTAVGAAASVASADLEAFNMPGTWITGSNTWRDVVKFIGAACQFAERFQGDTGGQWFTTGITLATTLNTLNTNTRNGLSSAATSFGLSTAGVTGSTTLRQVIVSAANQYISSGLPIVLAGVSLYAN